MATANSIACSLLQNESDDEESFVVLGHSLPPESLSVDCGCEPSESLNSTVVQESLKLTSNALSQLPVSTTSSFPSLPKVEHHDLVIPSEENYSNHSIQSSVDLGPDEIQQKVDSLVKENIKLKETLHQNNLAMKKQYDTLMLWQADVQKVHQSHKEKFAETKRFIENVSKFADMNVIINKSFLFFNKMCS
ncbi:hypothetical protein ILUMI_08797 [Ignelater luminosus]|uniref:NF-kappa-B essential modulator NEMO N-terminal domain-containing protein n=1 Tax=Ignelater luminosus TaxID=2038154 RepID=A0A8K0D107_IGNLU|nr:hypothetical protein ILUMI_08797 [Ignelater luminosus]